MKLTEAKLKQMINEMMSIGDASGELPPEVDKLSDFILSISDDPKAPSRLADQSMLRQAKSQAENLMQEYSDLLGQLKFNMKGKIMRKYGPGISNTRSNEYRNMIQFFELFEM